MECCTENIASAKGVINSGVGFGLIYHIFQIWSLGSVGRSCGVPRCYASGHIALFMQPIAAQVLANFILYIVQTETIFADNDNNKLSTLKLSLTYGLMC